MTIPEGEALQASLLKVSNRIVIMTTLAKSIKIDSRLSCAIKSYKIKGKKEQK